MHRRKRNQIAKMLQKSNRAASVAAARSIPKGKVPIPTFTKPVYAQKTGLELLVRMHACAS
jgi:hypothetical protein